MHGEPEERFWRRANGPEAEDVLAAVLDQRAAGAGLVAARGRRAQAPRATAGVVCLTAEYSDEAAVDRLIAEDIAFAKALFA